MGRNRQDADQIPLIGGFQCHLEDAGLPLPKSGKGNNKTGNPDWQSPYKAGKTKPIRVPVKYEDQVKSFLADLASGKAELNLGEKPPIDVQLFPVSEIALDPKRFQYKIVHGSSGSTGSLNGVARWDYNLAGLIQVWRDPDDGKIYCCNGHNRISKAKELGVDKVLVSFLDCSSYVQARFIAALTNIAEGQGTALDAAKLFRDFQVSREDLASKGLSLSRAVARDGFALSKLAVSLFDRAVQDSEFLPIGIAIGEQITSHNQQIEVVKLIDSSSRVITPNLVKELVELVANAGSVEADQPSLFGADFLAESLAIEKAELQAEICKRLSKEKRLFSTVANNSDRLEDAGNVIDLDASRNVSSSAKTALEAFNREKNFKGQVSDILNRYALDLHHGAKLATVASEAYTAILTVLHCSANAA